MTNYERDKMLKYVRNYRELLQNLDNFIRTCLLNYDNADETIKNKTVEFVFESLKHLRANGQLSFVGIKSSTSCLYLETTQIDELINEQDILENLKFN